VADGVYPDYLAVLSELHRSGDDGDIDGGAGPPDQRSSAVARETRFHHHRSKARPGQSHHGAQRDGNGAPYEPPGRAANRLRDTDEASSHYYVQIPHEVWTSGYMSMLTGPGVALLLILLDQYGPGKIADPHPVWFSPKVLLERYGLSDDTRNKA
jgi:hypothetical protein